MKIRRRNSSASQAARKTHWTKGTAFSIGCSWPPPTPAPNLWAASYTGNQSFGWPICPDFLRKLVALIHSMRLSLMKGAHAGLTSVPSLKFVKELLFGFVSGHDFSRAANTAKPNGLQPLSAVSGTFSIPRIVPGTSGTGN